jgi:Tfp pilus assembly protein PilX
MSMMAKDVGVTDRPSKPIGTGQDGVALLTVMMIMLILTLLGISALTTTGLENRMAGFTQTGEAAATASDSCLGVGANLIRQALIPVNSAAIPPQFIPNPVPVTNAVILHDEIYGKNAAGVSTKNSPDTATGVPNLVLAVNGFTVNGDIDFLYIDNTTATGGATTSVYQINCVATNVASGTSSSVTAVFACTLVGGSTECSKKF